MDRGAKRTEVVSNIFLLSNFSLIIFLYNFKLYFSIYTDNLCKEGQFVGGAL